MFDHLTDEKRSRISVNSVPHRAELDAAFALAEAAEPGEWRVEEAGEGFRLVRGFAVGRPELSTRASYALAAASKSLVPRLLRGIDALEQGAASAQNDAASMRRELVAEREAHAATVARQATGATGPEYEVELLARYMTLSAAGDVGLTGTMPESNATHRLASYTRSLLTRWAGGASIARELSDDSMLRAQRLVDERAKFRADAEAEINELRAKLRDALDKVARGEVPEVLQPALKEAKKRARKGGAV